jgi:FkbM family methyltransferase
MESEKLRNTNSEFYNIRIENEKIIKKNISKCICFNKLFILYIIIISLINLEAIYVIIKSKEKELLINEAKFENKIKYLGNHIKYIENELERQNKNNSIPKLTLELGEIDFEEFNEDILNKIKDNQNEFCLNEKKYFNAEYEKQLRLVDISYSNKIFQMYIYKSEDIVSNTILIKKQWEMQQTNNLLKALDYYSSYKNISKDHIYALDIGSNIGWYTLYLGKYGYRILSFEPSDFNMYILRKNYCLNNELNITLIKKGLYDEEKRCDLYISKGNIGDGWVFCGENINVPKHLIKSGEIVLTRLSNYASFLSINNLALIKIDVEGSEGKALISGIELIEKYKVPFILLELSPGLLRLHGTDPIEFLLLFERNGYKFSRTNYFANYITVDQIIELNKNMLNLYIVHSDILGFIGNKIN